MEIKRETYLTQLVGARENGFVKVVTGPRRCGKSYLLKTLFHNRLLSEGVDEDHIIEVDLEDRANKKLRDPDAILEYIKSRINDSRLYFVIMDEVQLIDEFVDVLNSLMHIKNVDTYVTGSNSHSLSTDIATEFRGRNHQIRVRPLSFSEYYSAVGGDKSDAWRDYYTFGGLPLVLSFATDAEKADYLRKLFLTVYMADILERYKIKNDKELRELVNVMASSIGSPNNPTKIANTFKSVENSNITSQTIDRYLVYLQEAFVIRKAERFDVKGRKYIGTQSKYYFEDLGIRNALINFRQQEENHLMENAIYNELCGRGYQVDVGLVDVRKRTKDGKQERVHLEVDFVVNRASQRYYIQSALTIAGKEKEDQELQSLLSIDDSFKKIVIVKDNIKPWRNEKGVLMMGLMDFLLDRNSLKI
ncbi:MAG: ATP-binding protein [Bacteroidales bacterium]|nr:ATP-binding protein [Bacteroidales bacterium]